ncbi:MAG: ammonium transporter [Deltaproteobacteria bacterium]|nr:ammonium transporter [Deltaproteobacteria bacterium]
MNAGDTAWMLVSTALVMLMTPGLALFYGGMVQQKNVLSTFMHSFFALGLVTFLWVAIGYSLAFAPDVGGGLLGGLDFAFFSGVGMDVAPNAQTIPHIVYALFQGMFAIITPALISGAYAERMKFSAYMAFTAAWVLIVYAPLAHWVWAPDGWLFQLGALDFAGGTVVHLSSGVSALVAAIVIGKRVGYPQIRHQPHNLTMTLIGAGLLWFGWFGFNGGSALGSNGLAGLALGNTHIAAAIGALAWGMVEYVRIKKVTILGVASGLVAGLVAITPAAGFVSPAASIVIGALAGVVCYGGVLLKARLGYDDALDAFGVHGIGGLLGAVLTGVFAEKIWNGAGNDGLLAGNGGLLVNQLIGVGAAAAFAGVLTWVILKLIHLTIGLRVDKDEEREGLDVVLHGESGYSHGGQGSGLHVHQVGTPDDGDAPARRTATGASGV